MIRKYRLLSESILGPYLSSEFLDLNYKLKKSYLSHFSQPKNALKFKRRVLLYLADLESLQYRNRGEHTEI